MIRDGMIVGISYVLTNTRGEELDRASTSEPFQYLHGGRQMIPGLEKQLIGLAVGARKQVTVPPGEAYGELNPALVRQLPRSVFPKDVELEAGLQFEADLGDGEPMVYTIRQVGEQQVTVDGNHPLAGEILHFQVEIVSVREATQEELDHGHAHGDNGHHHH